jgi:hypothetical protein
MTLAHPDVAQRCRQRVERLLTKVSEKRESAPTAARLLEQLLLLRLVMDYEQLARLAEALKASGKSRESRKVQQY